MGANADALLTMRAFALPVPLNVAWPLQAPTVSWSPDGPPLRVTVGTAFKVTVPKPAIVMAESLSEKLLSAVMEIESAPPPPLTWMPPEGIGLPWLQSTVIESLPSPALIVIDFTLVAGKALTNVWFGPVPGTGLPTCTLTVMRLRRPALNVLSAMVSSLGLLWDG